MKKDWRFICPLFIMMCPYLPGITVIIAALLQLEIIASIVMQGLIPLFFLMLIVGIIGANLYSEQGQYCKLAFWGILQKLASVPLLTGMYSVVTMDKHLNLSSEELGTPWVELLTVALYGLVVLILFGILLIFSLVILVVSGIYIIKAANLLYHQGYMTKVCRFFLVLGSILPVADVPCAIVVYIIASKYKDMQSVIGEQENLEKIEEN